MSSKTYIAFLNDTRRDETRQDKTKGIRERVDIMYVSEDSAVETAYTIYIHYLLAYIGHR